MSKFVSLVSILVSIIIGALLIYFGILFFIWLSIALVIDYSTISFFFFWPFYTGRNVDYVLGIAWLSFLLFIPCLIYLSIRKLFKPKKRVFPKFPLNETNLRENVPIKKIAVIPAFNEENTISLVVEECKNFVDEVIVVNDGSTDNTDVKAEESGALVLYHRINEGVGIAIRDGIQRALDENADIVITLDADGQHDPSEIKNLIEPILRGGADVVIGSRFVGNIKMPLVKKFGNWLFTRITRRLTGISLTDTQSGFRALNRDAAEELFLSSSYTYTQEMIIRLAEEGYQIIEIPITSRTRQYGQSRVIKNPITYGLRALLIILRTYRDYHPLTLFGTGGTIMIVAGFLFGTYLVLDNILRGKVHGHPSIILTALLILMGIQILLFGFMADMMQEQKKEFYVPLMKSYRKFLREQLANYPENRE